jgi:PGF-pre-PGF domain-containing protein
VPDIEEIIISTLDIPKNLTISCETADLPEGLPEPPGEVYRYYTITPGDANATIDEAVIRFSVPDTWIQENQIDINDLCLYRYNGNWTALATRWTGTTNETHTYEATSPGFSLFAISGKKVDPTATATVTPVKTATPVVSVTPAEENKTTNPLMFGFGHPITGLPGLLLDAVRAFFVLINVIPASPPPAADPMPEPVFTPDPVPATPAPVPTVDITRMQFALSVLSDPPNALIDLDGEYTGKTTPTVFTSLPGGNHTLRVRMDGIEPQERTVMLARDDEVLAELPVAPSIRSASPGPLPDWNQNCSRRRLRRIVPGRRGDPRR